MRSRGIEEPAATVAAELATLTLSRTIASWADPDANEGFAAIARRILHRLRTAAAELS